ncbi:hypothetical protein [Phenylobacterium sp.]|jgi:hypothetical protein|uniref:hypothetical protein n=1 Tax=Phenylobacterium sp. TaxID=1871053 RepID=UPI002F92F1DE
MAKSRKKVPKRLAGVKVPKPVRKGLKSLAKSQTGRTLIAEALLAAGAALAAVEAQPGSKARKGGKAAARKLKPAAIAATALAATAPGSLSAAFERATRSFIEALRTERRPPDASPPNGATH